MKIKVSDTKAFNVEGVLINGAQYISIRQLYATKKDPKFRPGRQGVTIPIEVAKQIRISMRKIQEGGQFKELNMED